MKKVVILHAQVPFERGGAEALVDGLLAAIERELPEVRAEVVQLPFKWYPEEQVLSDMMAWRLLDLTESGGEKIDLVIGTKFPSYAVRHPNKVIWLVHQHRMFYDLEGSEFDKPVLSPRDLIIRNKIRAADSKIIEESQGIYTISHTVSERLLHCNGIESTPLSPPSFLADRIVPGEYGDYILCFSRLNPMKRQHLLLEALALSKRAKVVVIGRGDAAYEAALRSQIQELGLQDRCNMLGYADNETLLRYIANARAVFYAPRDEDYGYAAIEGYLAQKPLITCGDSGEVRRFVEATGSGWIVHHDAESIAPILDQVTDTSAEELASRAAAGFDLAKTVTWKQVLDKIVVPYL